MKQQLLLGGKRTLNKAFRQALVLEVLKLTAGSSIGLQKMSDSALWRSQHPPKRNKRPPMAYVLAL
jgi:hypothetical protein